MNYKYFDYLVGKYHFEIGNRFRKRYLCSDNDIEVVGHDVSRGLLICRKIKYFFWQDDGYINHDIQSVADDIRCNTPHHWIQIDKERKDIK